MCLLHDNCSVITSDQAIHVAGFTLPQSRGIQAYWDEKSPTEGSYET